MKHKTRKIQPIYTDRYEAMGIPQPDPETCCNGHCEGTGLVPVCNPFKDYGVLSYEFAILWIEAHKKCSLLGRIKHFFRFDLAVKYGWRIHFDVVFSKCDGWHFVECSDCGGTGKRRGNK